MQNNNDTVPKSIAIAVFVFLGLLIMASFAFAGWSIARYRNNAANAVLALGKTVEAPPEPEAEEPEYENGEEPSEYLEGFAAREDEGRASERGERGGGLTGFAGLFGIGAPDIEPEPTPTPAPRAVAPRPTPSPTPTPVPDPVTCEYCFGTGRVICSACEGIGGGRGTPAADIPYTRSPAADIWWCSACAGDGHVDCRPCGGVGVR